MEKQAYTKRLTPSEIKWHYLKIEKPVFTLCPKPGESIIVNGTKLKMHSSQDGRIDGLAELYKNNNAKIGDNVCVFFISKDEISISFDKGEDLYTIESKEFREQNTLSKIIERNRELCKTKTYLFCYNEANVRIELIEPILKILGWRIPNLAREIKCSNSSRKVDIALFKNDKCALIIEAKSIDKALCQNPSDSYEMQLCNYLADPHFNNAKFGILTNGQVWQIRNKDGKILKSIDILSNGEENEVEKEIKEFFDLFKKDIDFDNQKEIKPETRPHYEANDRNFAFKIRIGRTDILGKNPTETFRAFLEKYREEIKKLQDQNRFVVKVVSENKKDLRNPKEGSGKLDGKKYYTTGDHSTYLKRMIIQQVIDELNLNDAEIVTIN